MFTRIGESKPDPRYALMIRGTRDNPVADLPVIQLFMTSDEAAGMLRISKRTLERMRVEGTGPRYLKVGPGKRSRVLYRMAEVEAWLNRHSYGSTSEYSR